VGSANSRSLRKGKNPKLSVKKWRILHRKKQALAAVGYKGIEPEKLQPYILGGNLEGGGLTSHERG